MNTFFYIVMGNKDDITKESIKKGNFEACDFSKESLIANYSAINKDNQYWIVEIEFDATSPFKSNVPGKFNIAHIDTFLPAKDKAADKVSDSQVLNETC